MTTTNTTRKASYIPDLSAIASIVPKPVRPEGRGRRAKGDELRPRLDANADAIMKMRQRHFTWADILHVLNTWGIKCSPPSISEWNKQRKHKVCHNG